MFIRAFVFVPQQLPALAFSRQRVRGALIFLAGSSNVQLFINSLLPQNVGKCTGKQVQPLGFCLGKTFPGTGIFGLTTQQLTILHVFSKAGSPVCGLVLNH